MYVDKYTVPSFVGARDLIDPLKFNVIWKNKTGTKKVVLGDYSYSDSCDVRYYYNYDPPPSHLNLDYTTKELVSIVTKDTFNLGRKVIGRHGQHILNKYRDLRVTDTASYEDCLSCIKLWEGPSEGDPDYDPNNLAPGDKYGWSILHSSYDKRFFKEFWPRYKDHYYSKFFWDKDRMIAYSILTRNPNKDGQIIYLFGKAATHLYKELSRYSDLYTVRDYIRDYNEDVVLNWADSNKGMLNYKKSIFPDWSENTIYYARSKSC